MRTELFCVSKAKYSGSFAEVKPLGLLLVFISQTQESQSTELLFDYHMLYVGSCWLERLALGAWLLPWWKAPLWKTHQKYNLSSQQESKFLELEAWIDWYIINCDWSAICSELVTSWAIRDKFFTCVWFLSPMAQRPHAINWRTFHAWN